MSYYTHAAIVGVSIYAITFGVGLLTAVFSNTSLIPGMPISPLFYAIQIATIIVASALGTWWFFSKHPATKPLLHGALLGGAVAGIGFILDGLLLLPALLQGMPLSVILGMYLSPLFALALVSLIGTPAVTAWLVRWYTPHQ